MTTVSPPRPRAPSRPTSDTATTLPKHLRLTLDRLLGRRANPAQGRLFELDDLLRYPRSANHAAIRSRCASAYLGDDTAIARVLGRFKMFVDTRDVGLSCHLLIDGYWEMWLTETMTRLIRPGMVVADVGANLGYFTLLMGELVGPQGRVHAFEPNPAMADRLGKSLTLNNSGQCTTLHRVALGDTDGEARIHVPVSEPKNASLVHADDAPDCVTVPLHRLDGFVELAHVDVLKIDVEGYEEPVWCGLSGILDSGRPLTIFIEVGPVRCADYAGLIADMRRRGFSIALLGIDGRMPLVTDEQLAAEPRDQDQMLVLRR